MNIPIAIVLAGALIAGAIYLRDSKPPTPDGDTPNQRESDQVISIKPISGSEHYLGKPDAPVTIVEYSDFDCPFCKTFHSTMKKLVDAYAKKGDIAWVYRHFPLYKGEPPLHPFAGIKAEASECVAEIGGNDAFWKYADLLFQSPIDTDNLDADLSKLAVSTGINSNDFQNCLKSSKYADFVESQYNEAIKSGGRGTPFNILLFKKEISGDAKTKISETLSVYGNDIYLISEDGKSMSISGALPYEIFVKTINTVLGK